MVHYAALPVELIFTEELNQSSNYVEITYKGVKMIVEPIGFGKAKILRLLSTDPEHYLNPEFQPGLNITVSY
jgi:hypothetical protein